MPKALEAATLNDELAKAYGQWFDSLGEWQWFLTITFRDPPPNSVGWTRPGWATAKRAWQSFEGFAQPPVGNLNYVRAFEIQPWRGAPHVHALLAKTDPNFFKPACSWLWKNCGMSRLLPYDPSKGAAFYITKYVAKDLSDISISVDMPRP